MTAAIRTTTVCDSGNKDDLLVCDSGNKDDNSFAMAPAMRAITVLLDQIPEIVTPAFISCPAMTTTSVLL